MSSLQCWSLPGPLAVGRAAEDVVVAVEVDVHLAAVVAGDLDLVEAVLVAGLGLGVTATGRHGDPGAATEEGDGERPAHHQPGLAVHAGSFRVGLTVSCGRQVVASPLNGP